MNEEIEKIARDCAQIARNNCSLGFVSEDLLVDFACLVLEHANYIGLKAESVAEIARHLEHGDSYGDSEADAVVIRYSFFQELLERQAKLAAMVCESLTKANNERK